jgi:hypothetical protein
VHALAMVSHRRLCKGQLTPFPMMEAAQRSGCGPNRSRCSRASRSPTTGTRASRASGRATSTAFATAVRRSPRRTAARGTSPARVDAEAMQRAAAGAVGRTTSPPSARRTARRQPGLKTLDRLEVARADAAAVEAEARRLPPTTRCARWSARWRWSARQWSEDRWPEALARRDRAALGLYAPAGGLYSSRPGIRRSRIHPETSFGVDLRRRRLRPKPPAPCCGRPAAPAPRCGSILTSIGVPSISPEIVRPAVADRNVGVRRAGCRRARARRAAAPGRRIGRGGRPRAARVRRARRAPGS